MHDEHRCELIYEDVEIDFVTFVYP